jgi:hypothetical protein
MIALLIVHDGPMKRCELFDEADLDAAIARLDELSRPAPQLETRRRGHTNAFGLTSRRAT